MERQICVILDIIRNFCERVKMRIVLMRKILITNDDGIGSDGLVRLVKAATEFGEVWVFAPESQRSAMSHSVTLSHSIEAWKVDFPVSGVHAYACDEYYIEKPSGGIIMRQFCFLK